MTKSIKICHLYPDLLNLYGDLGNIKAMVKHLEASNIKCSVDNIVLGDRLDWKKYDIFFVGGGQDFEQEILSRELKETGNDECIKEAIEAGKTFLAICGGYQMLGRYYQTWDGKRLNYIGAIDFYTVGGKERKIGNYAFNVDKAGEIVGFENHSGRTYLGSKVEPLGTVISGNGNNGEDKTEGVHYKNVFGTYSHGPILPKNPLFNNLILNTALKTKYGDDAPVIKYTDEYEIKAHEYMENRLASGKQASNNF
ncbi:glutamine amidotransferase [Candidatus Saccharibacteria bacterium]|nr:glutamine amidotransferase [Candidatus Saccharibacteria bacterium]